MPLQVTGSVGALKFVSIAVSASGDTTLVGAVAGKRIQVIGYWIKTTLAVTARFRSNNGGTFLTGGVDLPINGSWDYAGSIFGPAFETAVGESLEMNLSLSTGVNGHLTYVETP